MFLKSLVIKGFKSFAERSVLDLEPGITVVVGPNGSGKSNIVDAIAWVLGAQAPSAVRSQKMDDVIFAGTSRRQALGRAEVSLTIDNSSGYLAVEFSEVTISRTLFRSGESEYAINGVSCRLLDIQELLSDAGVGRNQHVIASQGQLDAILNARPEERRAIIEEAAGVLKHRRRRERSERRLAATEANLSRVNDLLREVRRQLRPLERQAEAARRHAEIADELRQLRVHLAGREITALDQRVEAGRAREGALVARRAEIDGVLVGLDADVRAAEGRLAAVGAREVAELVSRTETLRERARGTAAVLAERRRATERELAALDDRSALVVLDRELEAAHSEVAEAEANVARLVGVGAELAESEAALADERSAADLGDDGEASAAAEAATSALAEARRELTGLAARLEQRRAELARADERRSRLAQRLARLEAEAPQPEADDAAEAAADGLARAVDAAERTRAEADAARAEAEQRHRELEAEARAWAARAEALAQALESVRAEAGASELAGRPGVLGTVADVLAIEPGSEAAVEAALGDARAAVVVAGAASARDALEALIAVGKPASVLALPAVAGGARVASPAGAPSGAPSALGGPTPTPTSVTARPLRERVRARSGLPSGDTAAIEQLLDGLCAATFVVEGDWRAGVDLALAHPALTLVTTEGDRFAARGWRLQAAGAGATAALVEEATERATAAKRDGARAADEHRAAREAAEAARRAHTQAVRAFDDHEARR
ncbi:MAG: AAA family ATPase, partial [Acidimicrobiia bacterium]|nr:AAA family ATPase [Acidimicrobiia bacterium]